MNEEQLRQRLREGDPATGENSLDPGEIQAMRRAVLTAAPEPRRRLLPALALTGAAAALLIALFALRPGPVQPPAPPRIAVAPALPPAPSGPATQAPQPSPERTEPPARGEKKPIPRRRHRAAPAETVTLAALEPAGNPPEEPEIRQVQFSTPGGMRIIWTLTSGKASR